MSAASAIAAVHILWHRCALNPTRVLTMIDLSDFPLWANQASEYISQSKLLNSEFIKSLGGALVGAGAGAWAGAWAAQRIASREKLRDQLIQEVRKTNAAISITITIWNRSLSLKAQHVLELKRQFEALLNPEWVSHAEAW